MKSSKGWLGFSFILKTCTALSVVSQSSYSSEEFQQQTESATDRSLATSWATSFAIRGGLRSKHIIYSNSSLRSPQGNGKLLKNKRSCTLPSSMKFHNGRISKLVGHLSTHKPFTYLRFGDGDLYCLIGGHGMDSNGIALENASSMCHTLANDVFTYGAHNETNFYPVLGTFFLCKEQHPEMFEQVEAWFEAYPFLDTFSGFLDSDSVGFYFPLVPPMEPGRIPGVVPLLAGHAVVLVGPAHLGKLQTMLNYTAHIEVPLKTCWESRDQITSRIKQESQRRPSENVVFLVAGGIAARSIMYHAFLMLGQKDTFIDVGASLDGFAGVVSRDYNVNISSYCTSYPEYCAKGVCHDKEVDEVVEAAMEESKKSEDDDDDADDDDGDEVVEGSSHVHLLNSARSGGSKVDDNSNENDDDDDEDESEDSVTPVPSLRKTSRPQLHRQSQWQQLHSLLPDPLTPEGGGLVPRALRAEWVHSYILWVLCGCLLLGIVSFMLMPLLVGCCWKPAAFLKWCDQTYERFISAVISCEEEERS